MPIGVTATNGPRISAALIARWRAIPVTIASDVTGGRTLADPAVRLLSGLGDGTRLAGPAVTARCDRGDFGPVLVAIDVAGPGDVVAVDAGGRLDTAVAGEIVCGAARAKGIAGLVVDGPVRDIEELSRMTDFPVYARGVTARGPLTRQCGSVNGPVVIGGVAVNPGDLVLGDRDGLIVLSPAMAKESIEAAFERLAAEEDWRQALATGASLADYFGAEKES